MADTYLHGVEVVEVDDDSNVITTVASSIIGLVGTAPNADPSVFPLNTPVVIAGSKTKAASLYSQSVGSDNGTLPGAMQDIFDNIGAAVVVVRVDVGTDDTATMNNIIGTTLTDGTRTGMQALLNADGDLGYKPRILCAPGFTHQKPADPANAGSFLVNPVVSAFVTLATSLRAVAIIDGSNTTDADAETRASDFDSARLYLVDPWITVLDSVSSAYVTRPASASVAGLIAKTDNNKGFWWSPSNQSMTAVLGVGRSIQFQMDDSTSQSNQLNSKNVTTIIRYDGYRLWGDRTLSSESQWVFLCVRRTADIIADSLVSSTLWAVDRGITKQYVTNVIESVNAYLRNLKAQGAILGGTCWADKDLNTSDQTKAGKVYFDFDFTPAYPAEHVQFRMMLTDSYLSEVF